MKGLFWVLLLFAMAVGLSLVMQVNEGYVLVVLPPYRVELSLNLIILLALTGFVLFYALLRATALALALPRRLRESRARRESEQTDQIFGEGVRLYLAGDLRQAIDVLAKLSENSIWWPHASALAARAAGELGSVDEQRDWQLRAAHLGSRITMGESTTSVVGQALDSESAVQR